MGWLEELEYSYHHACEDGHITVIKSKEQPKKSPECSTCGKQTTYLGFQPMPLGGHMCVQKEQNGRPYYEYSDASGKVSRISKTKRDYLEKGDTSSKITKEYKNYVQDKTMHEFRKFQYQEALKQESKATVSAASSAGIASSGDN